MTTVNYLVKVHRILLSVILNPSQTKWYSQREFNQVGLGFYGKIDVKIVPPARAAALDFMQRF